MCPNASTETSDKNETNHVLNFGGFRSISEEEHQNYQEQNKDFVHGLKSVDQSLFEWSVMQNIAACTHCNHND